MPSPKRSGSPSQPSPRAALPRLGQRTAYRGGCRCDPSHRRGAGRRPGRTPCSPRGERGRPSQHRRPRGSPGREKPARSPLPPGSRRATASTRGAISGPISASDGAPGDLPVDRLLDPSAQAVEVGGGLHEVLHRVGKSSSAYAEPPLVAWAAHAPWTGAALSLAPWPTVRRPRRRKGRFTRSIPAMIKRATPPPSASSSSRPRTTRPRPSCGTPYAASRRCRPSSCRSPTGRAAAPATRTINIAEQVARGDHPAPHGPPRGEPIAGSANCATWWGSLGQRRESHNILAVVGATRRAKSDGRMGFQHPGGT